MATSKAIEDTPKEVVVGPYRYGIDYDGDASYDYTYSGVCLNRSRRIKLDPRQSDTEIPQTFLHEVIHAMGSVYEIEEWRKHTLDDDGKTIDQINMMATALLQFIRINPDIVTWLQNQK